MRDTKESIGGHCWAGYHSEMGVVICDPSKFLQGSKFALKVWSYRSGAFVQVDWFQLECGLLPLNTLCSNHQSELKAAANQYLSNSESGEPLYWHGIPGLLNPLVATGEMFLDQPIADSPWEI